MNWNFFKLSSLKIRVTLTTLAIFLVMLWSLAYYASKMLHDDMQHLLGAQQELTVSYVAAEINRGLEERVKGLELVAKAIDPSLLENHAALQKFIANRFVLHNHFNAGVFVLSHDGIVIADVPLETGRMGINLMERDAVTATLKEGKSVVGLPVMGKKLAAPIFHITVPIRDSQGSVIAALVGVTNLGIPNFLDQIQADHYGDTGGYMVLVSPQQRVIIAASDKHYRPMDELPAPGLNPMIDRFVQGFEGSAIHTNPLGVEVLGSFKSIPVAGWYVGAMLPTEQAFAPIHDTQQRMLLAATVLTLLAGILIWWTLRRQLSPMLNTARTLSVMSDTALPLHPLPITKQDEVGQLIAGFNRLLGILMQREAELRTTAEKLIDAQTYAKMGAWELLSDGKTATWSEHVYHIFGIPSSFQPGPETLSMLIDPNDFSTFIKSIQHSFATGDEHRIELKIRRYNDGDEIWIECRARLQIGKDGLSEKLVGFIQDITERKTHEAELLRVANYDILTGLPNRRLLADRLDQAIAHAQRSDTNMGVCFIDLDDFKQINDQHGHDTGDQLLIAISESIKTTLRAEDTLARLGGDEFVLIFTDLKSLNEIHIVLDRVLSTVSTERQIGDAKISISASVGVALFPADDVDADTLLRHADQAMYQAKEAGKKRYHLFNPDHDRQIKEHRYYQQRLRQALENDEFVLHYQPKVDFVSGEVMGAEALIRWQHPEQGLLSPGAFLKFLDGSDLEIAVGEWVIGSVLKQIEIWDALGLAFIVSANISANHLLQSDFADRLHLNLNCHPNVSGKSLVLEILETAAITDMSQAVNALTRCRELGVRISLDDFGTGYSSLTYLRTLPVDILKIDQSFVRDMLTDPSDLGIVVSVIQLAQTFNRMVIAEGVETLEHGAMLVHLGCRLMQGYGIARPMPAEQISDWVSKWRDRAVWHSSSRDDQKLTDTGESVAANFMQLVWHKAYECGNETIDREHQNLFNDANNLLAAILSGRSATEVSSAIEKLITDVGQHFQSEESIFLAAGYPEAVEHIEIHKQLVARATTLSDKFRAGSLSLGELFTFLAHDMVAIHMLGDDREFFPYLQNQE